MKLFLVISSLMVSYSAFSLDCLKAQTKVTSTICKDKVLLDQNKKIEELFKKNAAIADAKKELGELREQFDKDLQVCARKQEQKQVNTCFKDAHTNSLNVLNQLRTNSYKYTGDGCDGVLKAFQNTSDTMSIIIITNCGNPADRCEAEFVGLPIQKIQGLKDGDCSIRITTASKEAVVTAPGACQKLYCTGKGKWEGKYELRGEGRFSAINE